MEYNEGDLVLGTVERIENTVVFVKLSKEIEGTIISSEIAPGRIKNMREYVVPKKKIVCKILRVSGNHIDLSLRRVNSKEKKEVMQKVKQEQTSKSAFYSILKEQAEKIEQNILKEFESLFEFLANAREKEELIEKYIPSEFREAIKKITQKKKKLVDISHLVYLKCLEKDGLKRIREVFSNQNEVGITYISAGKFKLSLSAENYKEANKKMQEILIIIEKNAKSNKCNFSAEEFK